MTLADEAAELVLGDRSKAYGDPTDNFESIAQCWSGLLFHKLKKPITAEEAALLMVGLKLCREMYLHKADNPRDAAGYLLVHEWIHEKKRPSPLAHELAAKAQSISMALEDVCCGTGLDCPHCGKKMPCTCDRLPEKVLTRATD